MSDGARRTLQDQAMDYIRSQGIVRLKELTDMEIPQVIIRRLLDKGVIENPVRGVYTVSGLLPDTFQNYAIEAIRLPPGGVICLQTAAYLHGLTTRNPDALWAALPPRSWTPQSTTGLPVRSVEWRSLEDNDDFFGRRSEYPATTDVDLLGRRFRVTSPARTVADLFFYRDRRRGHENEEYALEALSKALESGVSIAELEVVAEQAGVRTVMAPYLAAAGATMNRGL